MSNTYSVTVPESVSGKRMDEAAALLGFHLPDGVMVSEFCFHEYGVSVRFSNGVEVSLDPAIAEPLW